MTRRRLHSDLPPPSRGFFREREIPGLLDQGQPAKAVRLAPSRADGPKPALAGRLAMVVNVDVCDRVGLVVAVKTSLPLPAPRRLGCGLTVAAEIACGTLWTRTRRHQGASVVAPAVLVALCAGAALAACGSGAGPDSPSFTSAAQSVRLPSARAARRQASCGPAGSRTLVAGQYVRVYTYAHPKAAQTRDAFACDTRSHVQASIVRYSADNAQIMPPPGIATHGELIAFGFDDFTNPDGAITEIDIETLSHPPNFYTLIASAVMPDLGAAKVVTIKVDGKGDAVWIACASAVTGRQDDRRLGLDFATGRAARCQRPGPTMWVYYQRGIASSVQRLLAHGRSIDPLSLRLQGSTATWQDSGRSRTADIAQAAANAH